MQKSANTTKTTYLPHLDDFLLNLQTNNYSQETIYNYERDLNVFEEFLSEMKLPYKKVNRRAIEQYKAYLTSIDRKTAQNVKIDHKLGSYSINRMLSSLRSYLKYLIDNEYETPISPGIVKLTKTIKKHPRVAELQDLIRLIESPIRFEKSKNVALRNRAMLETLFSTGLRISELVNLNKDQIDETGKIFVLGKGKKERFVYLTDRAKEHLKNYLATRQDQSPALFVPYRGQNVKTTKRRISINYIQDQKEVKSIGRNAPNHLITFSPTPSTLT